MIRRRDTAALCTPTRRAFSDESRATPRFCKSILTRNECYSIFSCCTLAKSKGTRELAVARVQSQFRSTIRDALRLYGDARTRRFRLKAAYRQKEVTKKGKDVLLVVLVYRWTKRTAGSIGNLLKTVEKSYITRTSENGSPVRRAGWIEYWTTNYLITHYLPQARRPVDRRYIRS